jgi:hypothetical protein
LKTQYGAFDSNQVAPVNSSDVSIAITIIPVDAYFLDKCIYICIRMYGIHICCHKTDGRWAPPSLILWVTPAIESMAGPCHQFFGSRCELRMYVYIYLFIYRQRESDYGVIHSTDWLCVMDCFLFSTSKWSIQTTQNIFHMNI